VTGNFFVTGTDTGVGKTFVTAALLRELRRQGVAAAACKPIACGSGGRDDARQFARLMGNEIPLDIINPIYLRHPLAPSVAARIERCRIDLGKIHCAFHLLTSIFCPVLVEGAGGLLVPIKRNYFVADLIREMKLPVIIVSRLSLGTINHTLLTVRQAQAEGLKVAGIILNDTLGQRGAVERTNIKVVPELSGVPLLGIIAHARRPDVRAIVQRLKKRLRNSTGS
jgi:dethiobiotin synthetase